MFIRKRKNKSGSISVVVVDKNNGRYKEVITIGTSRDLAKTEEDVQKAKEWIRQYKLRLHPELDLFDEEREVW